ncbi:MAG: ubiquinone-binding protein [Gammaproteobacteria bacterium]|nr:ubiquinone-binding protein [Gammaproteobacteria bacterium]
MESINKSVVVSYTAEQMYDLVNDVESYPVFLSWCSSAIVHQNDTHCMKASVSLAVGSVNQTFTTENTLQPGRRIDVRLLNGPFKKLQGFWSFAPAGDNLCKVSFQMNFEYKNLLVKLALNKVFQRIGDTMVASFVDRAKQIYGE